MHYDTGYVYVVIGEKLRISQVKCRVQNFFSAEFTLSKQMLGILLIFGGIFGFVGILMIDILDVGREGGIGPAQRLALGGCIALTLLGLTLLPLGKAPA